MPKPVKVVISGVDKLSAIIQQSSTKLDKFGAKARKIGKGLTLGVTLPLLGMGAASLKAADNFNQGMAQVATLVPGNAKRIQELSSSVKDLAVETGKGTDDVTQGLYATISAFGDTEETTERLRVALRASVAGISDTQSTLSMLSGVTKAYGDTSAGALKKVSDLSFKTVELGETSFPELATNMGKVNSLAVTLGLSQEEMFGVIAAGTGPMGNTADVTTKLKGAMISLMKPTKDMEIAFKKLGVKNGQQLVQQKGFHGALMSVTGIAKKYGVENAKLFGSTEGLQMALSLTGAQADDYTTKLEKLKNATGATDAAYKEMTEGVNKSGFTFRQFQQQINVLAVDIGNKLAPTLVAVLDNAKPLINGFLNLSDETKTWIITLAAIAATIGPMILGVGYAIKTLSTLGTVISFVGKVLMFLTMNPIGLCITAIGLLAFGVYQLIKHWDVVKNFFAKTWEFISGIFQSKIGGILAMVFPLVGIPLLIAANWDVVKGFFVKTWEFISGIFQSKIGAIIAMVFPLVGIPLMIAANWDKVTETFKKVLSVGAALGAKVKGFFGGNVNQESLASKTGLNGTDTGSPLAEGSGAYRAAEVIAGRNKVESTTNIKIENKTDAKIRTKVDKGSVNLETQTGELIPAIG